MNHCTNDFICLALHEKALKNELYCCIKGLSKNKAQNLKGNPMQNLKKENVFVALETF